MLNIIGGREPLYRVQDWAGPLPHGRGTDNTSVGACASLGLMDPRRKASPNDIDDAPSLASPAVDVEKTGATAIQHG